MTALCGSDLVRPEATKRRNTTLLCARLQDHITDVNTKFKWEKEAIECIFQRKDV